MSTKSKVTRYVELLSLLMTSSVLVVNKYGRAAAQTDGWIHGRTCRQAYRLPTNQSGRQARFGQTDRQKTGRERWACKHAGR